MRFRIFPCLIFFAMVHECHSQSNQTTSKAKAIRKADVPNPRSVRHSNNSKLPDTIHVVGKIIELTPGQCGLFCFGGSIKVELVTTIPNYGNEYAYIVTACMNENVKTGTSVDLVASKLTKNDKACYYLSNTVAVDSKGFPFYKLSEKETEKIQ